MGHAADDAGPFMAAFLPPVTYSHSWPTDRAGSSQRSRSPRRSAQHNTLTMAILKIACLTPYCSRPAVLRGVGSRASRRVHLHVNASLATVEMLLEQRLHIPVIRIIISDVPLRSLQRGTDLSRVAQGISEGSRGGSGGMERVHIQVRTDKDMLCICRRNRVPKACAWTFPWTSCHVTLLSSVVLVRLSSTASFRTRCSQSEQ